MARVKGMNKYQKAAHKPGEQRVSCDDIEVLLEYAKSSNVEERRKAAELLCPCHVRRRLEPVWEALYRLLEDKDERVQRAAWHTLDDGGRPDDPKLDEIAARVRRTASGKLVAYINGILGKAVNTELAKERLLSRPAPKTRGKCDFCGQSNVFVERDLDTMIPSGNEQRAAWTCENCR
jgi:hypothetical protein